MGRLTLALSMVQLCECYGQKQGRAPVGYGHKAGANRAREVLRPMTINFANDSWPNAAGSIWARAGHEKPASSADRFDATCCSYLI